MQRNEIIRRVAGKIDAAFDEAGLAQGDKAIVLATALGVVAADATVPDKEYDENIMAIVDEARRFTRGVRS